MAAKESTTPPEEALALIGELAGSRNLHAGPREARAARERGNSSGKAWANRHKKRVCANMSTVLQDILYFRVGSLREVAAP
jgi:hypothetical protein